MKVEILHLSPARPRHRARSSSRVAAEPRPVSHRPEGVSVVRWNPGRSGVVRRARGGLHRTFRAGVRARSRRRGASRRVSRARRARRALGAGPAASSATANSGQHARGRRLGRRLRRAGRNRRDRGRAAAEVEGLAEDALAQGRGARPRRERGHGPHRHRPRRGLQPSPPGALPDRGVGQRRRSRARAHEARHVRRPGVAVAGGRAGRGRTSGARREQRHGRRD